MDCFYHCTEQTDPYRNLALEEIFLRNCQADSVLLYLWQNDNTVVIGRNQNAWRECRLEAFEQQQGHLARRTSGGGAVYHDLGNQNFSFIATKEHYHLARQMEVVCAAVRRFGIDAQCSGRNDILVDGRKFSGNAFHKTTEAHLHHGTLLLSSDLSRLALFLAPSPEKLAAKGVKSVRGRVCNLCDLNPAITPKTMCAALLQAFGDAYGMEPKQLPDTVWDLPRWEALSRHYASPDWRLGPASQLELQLNTRLSFGGLDCLFSVEAGKIKEARLYSDAMDADWIQALESALCGQAFCAQALARAVPDGEEQAETAAYFADLSL